MATNDESLLRSASMSLCQFYIPQELAHATVEELGGAPTAVRTAVSEMRKLMLGYPSASTRTYPVLGSQSRRQPVSAHIRV